LDPDDKRKMMDADRAFSKLSEEKGMKNAFLEYIDSNGVLLRPNNIPLLGADAIDFLLQQNDTTYTLKWEPRGGSVARSGELGYTYGLYALVPTAKDTVLYGNYVSIWKKQSDGTWKFVLDSGNEGIGNPQ
jgi:ketosteroid isomerase-like protein